jgi:hypothetical protein
MVRGCSKLSLLLSRTKSTFVWLKNNFTKRRLSSMKNSNKVNNEYIRRN